MRPPRNESINMDDQEQGHEARRHGRLRTEKLRTVLGEVADLSASGMRLICKGRCRVTADQTLTLNLKALDAAIDVPARVVWINKTGFRKYELGLEFAELTSVQRHKLMAVARTAVDCCVMAQEH